MPEKSTGFRPNLLVKILKSTGQTCHICHMYGDGERGRDWLRAQGASPVSYRHNFLVFALLLQFSVCHKLIIHTN